MTSTTGAERGSDLDEWQVDGIRKAIASLDRSGGVPHEHVRRWIESWGGRRERKPPKRRRT